MTNPFHKGQRWISDSELELGLGSVERVSRLTVSLVFGASGEKREYAKDNAPLRRVRFHQGDTVKDREGLPLVIAAVEERRGLIYYRGHDRELCETALLDAISFNKPEERLFVGQVDPRETFALRVSALDHQHRRRRSPVRGFLGGRIDLIPHQLYIAAETSRRLLPRVLLADEVGLGKTIEACLILHRLILTGRAQRVLILVPDSLVHQWLVEMLRRFNVWFHIFDEARCAAIEAARPQANPFLEDQFVLASQRLFTDNERRVAQACEAGWDVLVVDEAHHLGWTPQSQSPEYRAVEALARAAPGLLLLTATPEQLGIESHFARLRLLDPARFHDLDEFIRETESYREVARQAEALDEPEALADLLDRHGTGRVMFRNTRATISGFPERDVRLAPLDAEEPRAALLEALAAEFEADGADAEASFVPGFTRDPRVAWLVDLLKSLGAEKVLLLCRTRAKAEALEEAIRPRFNVKMAVFHEGLSLVQRDRHAAWFAEEDGARLLICSEIGSEGRNFQFAHHLVLFDLPIEPELLEQRIGRLDRIGQTSTIRLHVPFVRDSAQEILARWYDLGLNSFRKNLHGGHALRERFAARIQQLAAARETREGDSLDHLIADTVAAREELTTRLEEGRDRLLELNSFRPRVAGDLVEQIRAHDRDESLDAFMIAVFDHFTIPVEEIARRTYRLGSSGVLADTFPGLPGTGLTITCDRARALTREDIQFVTWDHPLVTGALDLLLGSEKGNSSFAFWPDPNVHALYLEAVYLLECVAPRPLHADRFLPPSPLRVLLNYRGEDESRTIATAFLERILERGDPAALQQPEIREDLLPGLLRRAHEVAEAQVPGLVEAARRDMKAQLGHEIARLRELQKVNRSVRAEEIDLLLDQEASLDRHLQQARLRLDAIRLIQRGPR
ncbi:MAG: DEAD/DEAH box helicase family protein [Vicinamibacteria bacterium]|nr:DEAD/DEAH box helicase family protein [Vicinamibacteria bacterium]